MYVKSMIVENGVDSKKYIERPDVRQVEAAIRELDGQEKTMVVLEGSGESHMIIAGGRDRFVVSETDDNQTFKTLLDPSRPENEFETIVAGGQVGDYPSNVCVSMDLALQAARTYAEGGNLDVSLAWKNE